MENRKTEFKPFENRIWLSSPTMHGDELKYMTEAYDTNWMSTVGENIDEVEKEICKITGSKYVVALSSGTAAIHMAVKLAGVQPGDKVFVQDATFVATVNPVLYEKGEPVFIDSEYETWNMDPKALEKAFEKYPETRVVVAVDLYGTPAKYEEIQKICDKNGAILISDAAEALGAKYKGANAGTFGKMNIVSFNGNKIVTGSAGGAFLTDDIEAAEAVKKWSTQSRENKLWYEHEEIGYNYRMSNVIAGVVRGQLPYLQEHIERKKEIYTRYKEEFKGLPISMNPYNEETMEPNFWLSCMVIDKGIEVNPMDILEKLHQYNADGRPIWKPMHLQKLFEEYDFVSANDNHVSTTIFERGLCLPSDIKMTNEQQDKIIEIVKSCF